MYSIHLNDFNKVQIQFNLDKIKIHNNLFKNK